ncbi:hypothetical protein ACFQ6B_34465 [Streptomyces wedmorensis]|uniref:Secreted protein n=1 Tax=Streptomyces wedmorensis TaxID=43759 RepID=A0ABW6J7W8_STRWE
MPITPSASASTASRSLALLLAVAVAVDDRIPARHQFQAVDLLFSAATVADRHLTETWPATRQHTDTDSRPIPTAIPRLVARSRLTFQIC